MSTSAYTDFLRLTLRSSYVVAASSDSPAQTATGTVGSAQPSNRHQLTVTDGGKVAIFLEPTRQALRSHDISHLRGILTLAGGGVGRGAEQGYIKVLRSQMVNLRGDSF